LVQKICFFDLELNGVGSFDEFLKSYVSKDKVKNIRTSHSRGLIVDILPLSENSLHRFFPSYFDMIERNNSISLPKIYFTQIGKELKDSGKVWIASVGGVDAGSAITFESSGRIWSWFLQGDRKFKDYKVDARLYAEIIRYSIENNIPTVDFGTSPINSSLADFKMKFGANPVFHEKYLLNVSTKARLYYFLKKSLRPASN
jgi:lipid II:glycine glycyltransferase (peptidoglycan interpeptide bridge formation enzyme)